MTTETTLGMSEAEDEFGRLIDKLDNYAHALLIPIPAELTVKTLKECLPELVAELKKNYVKVTGYNPWENEP